MRTNVTVADLGASGTITFQPAEISGAVTLDPPYSVVWTRSAGVFTYDVTDGSSTIVNDATLTLATTDLGHLAMEGLLRAGQAAVSASFTIADMNNHTRSVIPFDVGTGLLDPPYTDAITMSDLGGGQHRAAYVIKNGSLDTLASGNLDYASTTETRVVEDALRKLEMDAVRNESTVADLSASFEATALTNEAGFDRGTDKYGGLLAIPSPNGGTGFFRMEKFTDHNGDDRWLFVTPAGNAFFTINMYVTSVAANGYKPYPGSGSTSEKYADVDEWKVATMRRLAKWGFNTVGGYSTPGIFPVPVYASGDGMSLTKYKMPFIRNMQIAAGAGTRNRYGWGNDAFKSNLYRSASYANDDLRQMTNITYYTGYRSTMSDFADPNFTQIMANAAAENAAVPGASNWFGEPTEYTPIFKTQNDLAKLDWCVFIMPDDTDSWYGFRRKSAAHPGYLIAISNPANTEQIHQGWTVTYDDTTQFSKVKWKEYLEAKYGTIGALNTAWGTSGFYSTFGSNPSQGSNLWDGGDGLMDENGYSSWMAMQDDGSGENVWIEAVNSTVDADIDDFIETIISPLAFGAVKDAYRAAMPKNLISNPASFMDSHPYIVPVFNTYLDVVETHVTQTNPEHLTDMEDFFDRICDEYTGAMTVWTTFVSAADSDTTEGDSKWGPFNKATQEARATGYQSYVDRLMDYKGSDGVYRIAGLNWWMLFDKTQGGEDANFGWVSAKDNEYNGLDCRIQAGTDQWGKPTGGEVADYGDFTTGATAANKSIIKRLLKDLAGVT
jgi:hypothetical protein